MKKITTSIWTSAVAMAASIAPVLAQSSKDAGTINVREGAIGNLGKITIGALISTVIKVLVIVAAVLFFLWLVLGGINWIVSGGDKAKTEAARQQITSALVGLVIVFSAWAIAQLIRVLFDVDLFNLKIEPVPTQ